jgi:streptogramin lyase
VWVAVGKQHQLVRIDARSGRVTNRIAVAAEPTRMAAGLGSVWVGARTGPPWRGQLIRYDTRGSERWSVPLPLVPSAVTTGGGFVWVTLESDPRLLRIDPRTRTVTVRTMLAAPGSALSYGDGFLWVTMNAIDSIARVRPLRGAPVTTGVGHRPSQSVTARGRVYVAVITDHVVQLVNPRTARLAGVPVRVDLNPFAIAAGEGAVWVTGLGENTVTRIPYR